MSEPVVAPIVPSEIIEAIIPSEVTPEISPEVELKAKEDPKFASRFAVMARKEKQLRERERAADEKQSLVDRYLKLEDLKKTNPAKWIKEHNLTFEQITHALLNGDEAEKEPTVEEQISELKRLMQEKDDLALKQKKEAEQRYIDEQIALYRKSIHEFVTANPDDYELIIANDAEDSVWDLVEEYYTSTQIIDEKTGQIKKEGIVLPVETAAKHVEDYFYEQSQKLLGLKKLKPKVSEPAVAAIKESTPAQAIKESTAPSSMTLTNAKVTGAVPVEQATRRLTKEEAFKKAAALIEWK